MPLLAVYLFDLFVPGRDVGVTCMDTTDDVMSTAEKEGVPSKADVDWMSIKPSGGLGVEENPTPIKRHKMHKL